MRTPWALRVKIVHIAFAASFAFILRSESIAQQNESLRARTPSAERQIAHPLSVPASQVTFLNNKDMVIGVSINGESNAYWLPMVIWVHRVSDRVGGVPILVTWCSMCNSGLVFRPVADGKPLTFEVTGLRGGNLVLKDHETGTSWQQATGEAFAGPLKGNRLPLVPFEITSWGHWKTEHPRTLAVRPDAQDKDRYATMDQRLIEPFWQMSPAPEALRQDPRLPPHEMVIGIELAHAERAYPLELIHDQQVINDQIGAAPVLILYDLSTDTITAFSRETDGRTLEFKASGEGRIADEETDSQWNSEGYCMEGKLKGDQLESLTPVPSFWFAWAEFHPQTSIYQPY